MTVIPNAPVVGAAMPINMLGAAGPVEIGSRVSADSGRVMPDDPSSQDVERAIAKLVMDALHKGLDVPDSLEIALTRGEALLAIGLISRLPALCEHEA